MIDRKAIGCIVNSAKDEVTGEYHVTYTPIYPDTKPAEPLNREELEELARLSTNSGDKSGDNG